MGAIRALEGCRMLTHPVSLAIRQVTGRRFSRLDACNIPRFNDDPATNHVLVLRVLFQARENVISQLAAEYAVPTWRRRLRRLYHALPVS
jgi:hypothetical protein